jgi:hypothetical protein
VRVAQPVRRDIAGEPGAPRGGLDDAEDLHPGERPD